ncbi:Alpha/Beta hydrolase protein [Hypoxylon fuscum]|nr:Alpha/Beta hydrolase protein [Hypoxylon fuscum]
MCAKYAGDDDNGTASPRVGEPEHQLLVPELAAAASEDEIAKISPLVICFHGSGESCSPSWDALAGMLTAAPHRLRVLLYDRGPLNPKPAVATADLRAYLKSGGERTKGPYVLVAHSYGGAFARLFLEEARSEVAGLVLVETGQEGGLGTGVEERQYARRILGMRPLSVVRGNSLLRMQEELAEAEAGASTDVEKESVGKRREMLELWDKKDQELKKRQLDLSRETAMKRYVHVSDCGHHVVRDRPDIVANEVAWVVENSEERYDDEDDVIEEEGKRHGAEAGVGRGEQARGKMRRIWERIATMFGKLRRFKK